MVRCVTDERCVTVTQRAERYGALRGREAGMELGDAQSGGDSDATMELELLGVRAEMPRDLAAGVAFAFQAIDEAPRFGAGDGGAVREAGADG
jgi:hypothetical protein